MNLLMRLELALASLNKRERLLLGLTCFVGGAFLSLSLLFDRALSSYLQSQTSKIAQAKHYSELQHPLSLIQDADIKPLLEEITKLHNTINALPNAQYDQSWRAYGPIINQDEIGFFLCDSFDAIFGFLQSLQHTRFAITSLILFPNATQIQLMLWVSPHEIHNL